MEHKQISSPNGSTHYWVNRHAKDNAKWIIFTHGLTANHKMFKKQVEYFSKKFSVITWDVPLHGLSRPYENFTYENTAIELNSILKNEGIEKAVLVGMSMGGYPSQIFASLYPQKVSGFVALGTTPFGTSYYSKSDIWWLKQIKPMAKCFPEKFLRSSMANSVSRTEYSKKLMFEMLATLSKTEIIEQMDIAYGVFIKENKDLYFNFPMLLLVGEHDSTGKVLQYNKEWAKKESCPLKIISDAAHMVNCDNPDQVNLEIDKFMDGLK